VSVRPGASTTLVRVVDPTAALGRAVLREYMTDVASRYYGRPATREEVDAALRDDPSDDLVPPGPGRTLVTEVERLAREHGARTLRLDTRADLVEARRLYSRLGFAEVPAFNRGRYAEHWFAKMLG
jgi:hypothetical protein